MVELSAGFSHIGMAGIRRNRCFGRKAAQMPACKALASHAVICYDAA
jgi:hypothetical protein